MAIPIISKHNPKMEQSRTLIAIIFMVVMVLKVLLDKHVKLIYLDSLTSKSL
jgi:hypothetical protein